MEAELEAAVATNTALPLITTTTIAPLSTPVVEEVIITTNHRVGETIVPAVMVTTTME